MLDVRYIRENKQLIAKVAKEKGLDINIDYFLELDKKRHDLMLKTEDLRRRKNENASSIVTLEKNSVEFDETIKKGKEIKNEIDAVEVKLNVVENEFHNLMLMMPNIPSDDTPVGPNSESNREVSRWGEPRKFNFAFKDHLQIGENLKIIDVKKGTKTSGFRGYYLKGDGAILHMAILNYAFKKMIAKGFIPFIPPTLIKKFALEGSGHFPFGKEEIYEIGNPSRLSDENEKKEPVFLSGTSEPSLLAYYSDSIFNEDDLPVKVCAFSSCYRSEVGSYGKDTKGLYRVHEFMKVEQIIICKNDPKEADEWQEYLRSIAEEILQDFNLPYRVIITSTGDQGAGKYRMYDVETWMPSRNSYCETHSDSNLTDWQARRLNIKYRDLSGNTKYVYTLNNTVIASPRILIAILENHQNSDGTITVPEALVPYVGKKTLS